jgi:hypothetical protein
MDGLDSRQFKKREASARELVGLGTVAEPALREALADATSPEVRNRIVELLRGIEEKRPKHPLEELAHLRAIQALERIGTAEARRVLRHLADGTAYAQRTLHAREALQRLEGTSR